VNKALALAAVLSFAATSGGASTLEISAVDAKGAPVADAVIYAIPKGPPPALRKRDAAIEQRDKTFVPLVTVVQTGSPVQFPNRDPIRHHVYSFSKPKVFELKLYAGTPAAPVVFDKPGLVVLGCNIHDPMIAYVYVVDSPWFAKTGADGKARIAEVPAGEYDVYVQHFAQVAAQDPQPHRLRGDESLPAAFVVPLRQLAPRPGPQ
jgi:plastocyanin